MDPTPSEPSPPQGRSDPSELSAGAGVLLAMLVVFGLAAAIILVVVVGPPEPPPEARAMARAYSPADFPDIYEVNPIEGLDPNQQGGFQVPPPPFQHPDLWPCSDCHEGDPGNPTHRQLTFHTDIVLHHGGEHQWCLDCHLDVNRDMLHLADGTPVSFAESYELCGQCHGHEYGDWQAGAHGRRVGFWNGPRRYLLCVHCHDPHSPHFRPLRPLPPPVLPQLVTQEYEGTGQPGGSPHDAP